MKNKSSEYQGKVKLKWKKNASESKSFMQIFQLFEEALLFGVYFSL